MKNTLPKFKNVPEIMKYIKKHNITVNFSETEEFGYHIGKNIHINRFLDNDIMTFIITHELAHIASKSRIINNFTLKLENADKMAVEALREMDEDEKNSFFFKDLLTYSYFSKLKGIV